MRVTRSSASLSGFGGSGGSPGSLTLAELVETYLAQHDVQSVTIEKLRYLLSKATAVFGDRKIGELTSQEIAAWGMKLSPGYRFEATQALRQMLHRANLRPLTLHGRQPDHDRPPLRPPRPRRTRDAIKLLDALNAPEFRPVDAGGRSVDTETEKTASSPTTTGRR
jgi:hypothetical protein